MELNFKEVEDKDQSVIYNIYKVISLEMDIETLNSMIQKEKENSES